MFSLGLEVILLNMGGWKPYINIGVGEGRPYVNTGDRSPI